MLATTIERGSGMHPEVAEMRKRSEPLLRLALDLFKRGDRETKDRVAEVLGRYFNCEISARKAMKMLRELGKEKGLLRGDERG